MVFTYEIIRNRINCYEMPPTTLKISRILEVLNHPSYRLPSFCPLKDALGGRRFAADEERKEALCTKPKIDLNQIIGKFMELWTRFVENQV